MDAKDAKIELLQNLVARLQNELARFITPAEIDQAAVDQAGVDLGVLSWQTSTEHMSPLLTAYDRRIEELEARIEEEEKAARRAMVVPTPEHPTQEEIDEHLPTTHHRSHGADIVCGQLGPETRTRGNEKRCQMWKQHWIKCRLFRWT